MAIRDIATYGDEVLRRVCKPVAKVDDYIRRLLDDMVETMRQAEGVGLAAPQVSVLRRVCVVEVEDKLYELINPELLEAEGEQSDPEGCLSVPGRAGMVTRPQRVKVQALNREGELQTYDVEGYTARAFCHEMDHLDGKLYIDIMTEEVDLDAEDEA